MRQSPWPARNSMTVGRGGGRGGGGRSGGGIRGGGGRGGLFRPRMGGDPFPGARNVPGGVRTMIASSGGRRWWPGWYGNQGWWGGWPSWDYGWGVWPAFSSWGSYGTSPRPVTPQEAYGTSELDPRQAHEWCQQVMWPFCRQDWNASGQFCRTYTPFCLDVGSGYPGGVGQPAEDQPAVPFEAYQPPEDQQAEFLPAMPSLDGQGNAFQGWENAQLQSPDMIAEEQPGAGAEDPFAMTEEQWQNQAVMPGMNPMVVPAPATPPPARRPAPKRTNWAPIAIGAAVIGIGGLLLAFAARRP